MVFKASSTETSDPDDESKVFVAPGNSVFALHVNSEADYIYVLSFNIVEKASTGVKNVVASGNSAFTVANGVVTFADAATDATIVNAQGVAMFNSAKGGKFATKSLARGIYIVSATVNGQRSVMKIAVK